MNDDICTNCGHWKGLHHFETNQCPAGGEAPVGRKQNWLMSIYQAPDKRDATIAAQAATIAQLRAELANILVTIFLNDSMITNAQADAIAEKYWNTWEEVQAAALKGGE